MSGKRQWRLIRLNLSTCTFWTQELREGAWTRCRGKNLKRGYIGESLTTGQLFQATPSAFSPTLTPDQVAYTNWGTTSDCHTRLTADAVLVAMALTTLPLKKLPGEILAIKTKSRSTVSGKCVTRVQLIQGTTTSLTLWITAMTTAVTISHLDKVTGCTL